MKRKLHAYKKTVSLVNEKAIAMFEGIARGHKSFLLESYDKNNGRYSFFGIDPEEIITSKGNSLVVTYKDGYQEVREGNPLERLKEYYSDFEVTKDDGELAMLGGLVGSLGYDFIRYSEKLPDENPDEIGIETIQLMLTKEFITIDHVAETMSAVVLEDDTIEGRRKGESKAAELVNLVRNKKRTMLRRIVPKLKKSKNI
jgi:anthranilate synthase component 1